MASLSPPVPRPQKPLDRAKERYELVFIDPSIVKDGITTSGDHNDDEEALTQGQILAAPSGQQVFDGRVQSAPEINIHQTPVRRYKKRIGPARRPWETELERDLEAAYPKPQQTGTAHPVSNAAGSRSTKKPKAFEILHNWTHEPEETESVSSINVIERKTSSANKISSVRGHVSWLHSEESGQSLTEFEQLFTTSLAPRIRDRRLMQTTASLLKRVRLIAERKTAGGKYLNTGPVRYDGVSSHIGDRDRPCMFFSFPYLAVGDFSGEKGQESNPGHQQPTRDSSQHPVRMLLQSRYRRESTKARDDAQSITDMLTSEVKDCIQLPQDGEVTFKGNKWKQRIHVPQLWGLSVSGDIMVTSAPLSEKDLRGSFLAIKYTAVETQSKPAIIRFNFEYDGRKEPFVYPVDQCNWYFGLLNKERQILDTLGKNKPGKFMYKLYKKQQQRIVDPDDLVTSDNWLEILHAPHNLEQLDLWMECESPEIAITPGSDDDSTKSRPQKVKSVAVQSALQQPRDPVPLGSLVAQTTSSTLNVTTHGRSVSGSSAGVSAIGHSVKKELTDFCPFLQWPLEDTLTKADDRKPYGRPRLWLDTVLVQVAGSRYNDMDQELQSLCTGIKAGAFPPKGTTPSTTTSPISRSSHPQVLGRLRAAASKTPVSSGDLGAGASQAASLQKLHDLVEDIRSTTNTANTNDVALAQTFKAIQDYWSLPQQDTAAIDVMETLFRHMNLPIDLQGMTRDEVESQFPSPPGHTKLGPRSTREAEAVLAKGKHILALFVPEKVPSSEPHDGNWETSKHPLVGLYWGLQDRLIEGILSQSLHATEMTMLLKGLSDIIGLAEILHKGVRKRKSVSTQGTVPVNIYGNIDSLFIQTPIPDALEHAIHFLFDVIKYMSSRSASDPPGNFPLEVGLPLQKAEDALRLAERYLIEEADQSALDAGLGPVVTPEAITLVLLERLSCGVYENGTINIFAMYEKIVENLALQVERKASRYLLLELNRVSEEIQIILDVLNQQKQFFEHYGQLLDPINFDRPPVKRWTRFPYEKTSIDRNVRAMAERISDFEDLLKRTDRLSVQNVQLVEIHQDDNNKTLMIFTLITIIFLPLSFVTGFFGMNLEGISGTTATVTHFWVIAIPVTGGVGIISLILIYWGRICGKWKDLMTLWDEKQT